MLWLLKWHGLRRYTAVEHVQSTSEVQAGFVKAPEQTFGKPHPTREKVKSAHRIVVKVGHLFPKSPSPAVLSAGLTQLLAEV